MNSTSKKLAVFYGAWESSLARWLPKAERSSAHKTPGARKTPPHSAKIKRSTTESTLW